MRSIHPDHFHAPLTPAFAEKIIGTELDKNGDGIIDRAEWIAFITQTARVSGERPMLQLMKILGKKLEDCWMP